MPYVLFDDACVMPENESVVATPAIDERRYFIVTGVEKNVMDRRDLE